MLAFLLFFFTISSSTFLGARAEETYVPKSRALIVGVSEYEDGVRFRSLPWVENDVEKVEKAFEKLGFETTTVSSKRGFPTLKNVEKLIEEICDQTKENDVLVVYFSVHGFAFGTEQKTDSQESYLALKDSKWDGAASRPYFETCLSVRWIRERMHRTSCKNVLLLLDACSSGGARAPYVESFPENCVKLEDGSDVATFASCRAFEKSERVNINGQTISFFTYWLLQGLGGFADENLDGTTTTEELFGNIAANVEWCKVISKKLPSKSIPDSQFPMIVQSSKPGSWSGTPFELLKTIGILASETAVDQVADQIVSYCDLISVLSECKVRVDDRDFQGDDAISFDFVESAEEKARIEDELKSFLTWLPAELRKALRKKGGDLGLNIDPDVQERDADMKLSAVVNLKKIDDRFYFAITFKIKLPKFDGLTIILKALIAESSGTKDLGPTLKSDPPVDQSEDSQITTAIVLPSVSFHVFSSSGERFEREPFFHDGATWIELNAGETFQIKVDARDATNQDSYVGMKLLIDGVDSLNPKRSIYSKQPRLVYHEGKEQKATSGNDATSFTEDDWKASLESAGIWAIRVESPSYVKGFQHKKGIEGKAYEFKVEEREQNGTKFKNDIYNDDEVGLITFCFVELKKNEFERKPNDVIVAPGREISSPTEIVPYSQTGKVYGTLRVRYASREKMKQLDVLAPKPVSR